jgi:hypothetical protein
MKNLQACESEPHCAENELHATLQKDTQSPSRQEADEKQTASTEVYGFRGQSGTTAILLGGIDRIIFDKLLQKAKKKKYNR